MINFTLYDAVTPEMIKGTYIDINYERLYSREMKRFQYNTLLKKYNPDTKRYDLYIALTKHPIPNAKSELTFCTKHKQIKVNLNAVWKDFKLDRFKQNFIVNYEIVEEDDDGIIYYIDV